MKGRKYRKKELGDKNDNNNNNNNNNNNKSTYTDAQKDKEKSKDNIIEDRQRMKIEESQERK